MNGGRAGVHSSGGHWELRQEKCRAQGEGHLHLRAPTNLSAEKRSLGRRGSGVGAGDRAQLLSHIHTC